MSPEIKQALDLIHALRAHFRALKVINVQIAPFVPIWYTLDAFERVLREQADLRHDTDTAGRG